MHRPCRTAHHAQTLAAAITTAALLATYPGGVMEGVIRTLLVALCVCMALAVRRLPRVTPAPPARTGWARTALTSDLVTAASYTGFAVYLLVRAPDLSPVPGDPQSTGRALTLIGVLTVSVAQVVLGEEAHYRATGTPAAPAPTSKES